MITSVSIKPGNVDGPAFAGKLRAAVVAWLGKQHPELSPWKKK
jgi:hypothetical protein